MTDSNLNIDKDNILSKQIDADDSLSDIKFDKLEPLSKFNIQTEGFLNFNANLNTENIINDFFIKDDELDAYIDDTIDPTKATFNALSVDKPIGAEEKITDLKPVLNFLSLHNFIKEKDFKRPSDIRLINDLLLEHTGYSWNQFNSNLIPRDVIESNEFQEGLLKIRTHYENDGFVIEDLEASNESELLKLTKGLGVEIGTGLLADALLAPLLPYGPPGWIVYGVSQFVIGLNANIQAQKIRIGKEATIGTDWINWNEAIAAGFVQMVPLGVTAKGWKGIRNSAIFGSSLAVTETGIRDLLGDDVGRDEYLLSIGVGGALGAGFKGTFEGLEGIFKKFKGNNNVDLNKLLTKEDKDLLIKSNNELKEINTKQIEAEGGDVKKLENDFKTQIEQQQQQQQQPQGNTKKNQDLGDLNLPDTRGKNVFYHGASQEFTLNESDTFGRAIQNLYGDGLYVTDDLVTSFKYRNKNKIKGQETEGIVYEIIEKQPVKFFDLDAPATPERIDQLRKIFDVDNYDSVDIIDRALDELGPNPSIGQIYNEIKLISDANELSASTTADLLSSFTELLQREGYGGFTHQGGNLAGGGERLHQVKIYFDPTNQIDIKQIDLDQFKTNTSNQKIETTLKNQGLGDSGKTPNQFSDRGIKSENLGLIEELIRLKKLKNEQGTSPVKTKYAMQLAGLKLFDDQVVDLSKTTRIKEYAQIYATINDIVPSEDLTVALTQALVLATDEVVNANTRFINALNSKDIARIEKTIDDLNKAFDQVNDWLGLSLPSATTFGRTGQALQIQGESGVAGKSVEEVMRMSQAEKRIAAETTSAKSKGIDERIKETSSLKEELQKVLEETKQTGDFSELYRISNKIEQTNGDVEKIVAIEKYQILPSLLMKGAKIFNEVGINALLAAPTTQEVNLLGGILNTYLNSFKFALGARNKTEIEAALRHFIALHSNFNFARKAWKRSWNMEDNFINLGNSKFESTQDRYQIATTNTDWVSRIGINWTGKGIRLPSRLMTSNDALIQASNLIGYANMKFFLHGKNNLKLKGDKLNEYIDDGINTILEYYLSNGKAAIPPDNNKIISRILEDSQEFSKSITFTNDIRTESIFGKGGKGVDRFAQNPLARIYFTFVKVPVNLIAEGFRLHPLTGIPITIGKNNKFFVGNSKGQNLNLVNEALSEVRHDLLSRDPLVVQRARGGMNLAQGLLLTVAGMSVYYGNKFLEEDYVPPIILTGSGPDYRKPEGKAMWKAMWKNGWRSYSVGKLQYNEDGSPKFKNGEPVYKFSSYQNIGIDPLSQVIGMTVDFVNSQGYINGKPYEDFTVGLVGVFSRNIFNASYTRQIDEFIKLLTTAPSLVDETGENPLKDYKVDKTKEYLAKQVTSRIVPYSNLLARFKQIPGDILELVHGREEVASDKDMSRFIQQRDTKVRPGDVIDQNLEIEDENFNEREIWKELQTYLNNNLQSKVPFYSADLPFLREHITNDPVLVPFKEGPFFFKTDLFSLQKHSTNKNYPIYQTLKLIGRQLPEPKDVIYGRYSKDEIEPKKLDTREYALLREFVNTHIPKTEKYGKVNLLQAINKYLDTKEFKILKEIIEKHGLSSDKGQIAAKEIYSNLYSINNYYIKSGEYEFFEQKLGTEEIKKRVEKKGKIMEEFVNEIQQELSNY